GVLFFGLYTLGVSAGDASCRAFREFDSMPVRISQRSEASPSPVRSWRDDRAACCHPSSHCLIDRAHEEADGDGRGRLTISPRLEVEYGRWNVGLWVVGGECEYGVGDAGAGTLLGFTPIRIPAEAQAQRLVEGDCSVQVLTAEGDEVHRSHSQFGTER